jgi:hypothetical protein
MLWRTNHRPSTLFSPERVHRCLGRRHFIAPLIREDKGGDHEGNRTKQLASEEGLLKIVPENCLSCRLDGLSRVDSGSRIAVADLGPVPGGKRGTHRLHPACPILYHLCRAGQPQTGHNHNEGDEFRELLELQPNGLSDTIAYTPA